MTASPAATPRSSTQAGRSGRPRLDQRHLLQRRPGNGEHPQGRRQDPGRLDTILKFTSTTRSTRPSSARCTSRRCATGSPRSSTRNTSSTGSRASSPTRSATRAAVAGHVRHRPFQEDQRHARAPRGRLRAGTLSRVVAATIRQEDVFARYGGEEFAVICRGVDLVGAAAFGERIRRMVAAQLFDHDGQDHPGLGRRGRGSTSACASPTS